MRAANMPMTRADVSRPRVTAVIPAHNMEEFLERAILSAVRQTYPELDIVVVDDGSTDGTRAIAERMGASHERIRVETIANSGVAAARNLGTELARSTYVAYLDGDDLWHPEKIEKQVAALAVHGHDGEWAACYTLSRYADVGDRVLGNGPLVEARGDFFLKHLYRNHMGNGSHIASATYMVDPAHSGRGVGRALCEYTVDWARAAGYRAMQFNAVVETNTYAVKLYRSIGFDVIGTLPEGFQHPTQGYVGLHIMHKAL